MLGFLFEILGPFWKPIAAAVGLALAGLAAYLKGRSEQAAKGKIAAQKETIDAHETRDKIEAAVDAADATERQRLRDKWTRD